MELIQEVFRTPVKVLEDEGATGTFRFEAVVSQADFLNQNRRVYPQEVLFPAFDAYNSANDAHMAEPGLVDHPFDSGSVSDIGIAWEKFWFEGKQVLGRGRVVLTQRGRDLKTAMEAGIPVGFSTRGYGVKEDYTAEDGRPATRMTEYELVTVDAVLTPSVNHARVLRFTKEELEKMEQELSEARAALEAALARVAELEAALAERDATIESLNATAAEAATARTELESRVAELETIAAELNERKEAEARVAAENALTAKLNELTEGHRFAPTIIAEARELGVTIESAEKIVARLTALVEAAGAAANNDVAPRGVLENEEDVEASEPTVNVTYTAEQLADLRGANLISEREYQEYLAQLG